MTNELFSFNTHSSKADVCVVGGAGHVGLPLALVFAERGQRVLVYDINVDTLRKISEGHVPFYEKESEPLLRKVLDKGNLILSSNPADLTGVPNLIITIGTPIDEFMNPVLKLVKRCFDTLLPYLTTDQLIVLRSTVYPGTTEWLDTYLKKQGFNFDIAFCPERIVQGYAIEEVQQFPQLVSGNTAQAQEKATALFSLVAPSLVHLSPMEAEFAKLFTNAYRYIQFAAANQFYMIANSAGVDYNRVLVGMKDNYPRARDIPGAGFAAGPCLLKDTMQLAAFAENQFNLGHAAMNINEGLVLYVVNQIEKKFDLENTTVGLLGMAFKANNDDTRSSLSYKMKNVLSFKVKQVLTTDPMVTTDPNLLPLAEVIERSDVLIMCAPHSVYRDLDIQGKPLIDIWGYLGKGSLI